MDYEEKLLDMLKNQIVARGIDNPQILEAMQRIPRHLFVPEAYLDEAYEDHPIALPEDRATISQPYMVAYMTNALQCNSRDRVLEIGTGSGYQAAIFSYLCDHVYTVERHYSLSINAQRTLQNLGRHNVYFRFGDGLEGWEEHAPFDRIIVTAAARKTPPKLLEQLKENGILLIPLGDPHVQTLTRIRKRNDKIVKEDLVPCVFVPLISDSKELNKGKDSDLL